MGIENSADSAEKSVIKPPPRDARNKPGFRGSARLRIGRWSEVDCVYFVTVKTVERDSSLSNPATAGIVMRSIEWMETEGRWEWSCYVVMPDHLHLVLKLKQEKPLERLLGPFKKFTAGRINETLHRSGRFWQDSFFDHRLRTEEKLEWVAFYCLRNPVRAGFVLDGEDWPFFKCKPDLWKAVKDRSEELLKLESERKGWQPPPMGEFDS
jgi:putative transposase